ncbi:glycerol kinase GlpK [Dysgonomonas macrotermitis]|uniref:Glycerol kinase n=1 Tax=Dysgonomonas macrotermitis TaxID=1346286 RepID=A0A1M5F973_9BACT|nr:glycerol kinase GlpK [Dysgonomonas macrotermitis]SHF87632.1 glycerol kinase [Dysgonomonas macrotermitis]
MKYIITIDQSTSATKAILFNEKCQLINKVSMPHKQYYPKPGWVEHDAEEIYDNLILSLKSLLQNVKIEASASLSLAITNQRETVVVWNKLTGKPINHAVVWQCQRGAEICAELEKQGYAKVIKEKTGLIIDPYFSASGVKWLLDNVEGAREAAEKGDLLMGTIDCWLIWKLTKGEVHATDYTNASRTMLFNINTLEWDEELLDIFTIPQSMMPDLKSCDDVFGKSDFDGLLSLPIPIAGVIGDSHGALVGQMCFEKGMAKATYGTGSSLMVNIGEKPISAPEGLVTSVGFSACNQVYYVIEGNIHCTGATINWMVEELKLIDNSKESESLASSIPNNGGVYLVPAFAGLGAPWWNPHAKAIIVGMTLGTGKVHVVRAGLEAIAYQVKDLVDLVKNKAHIELKEVRADGGPTKNSFLMQYQADMLDTKINRSDIEEASAIGAAIMNGLSQNLWENLEEVAKLREKDNYFYPDITVNERESLHKGWLEAVNMIK